MKSTRKSLLRLLSRGLAHILATCILVLTFSPLAQASSQNVKVIFIIPSSHWDLGFLRPPLQEMDAVTKSLDQVILACKADPQFRWTIESVWQLNAWLERTKSPAKIREMAALLRDGQIELSAADGSMHTEFMGSEELNRLIYAARQVGNRFGIDPQVAMMNDVPGFSLRLPQVLMRSGVKYFITGSNTSVGGGTSLYPGKMPIYWEGPDGSRVLMWQTQSKDGGYTEGLTRYFLDPSAINPYSGDRFYPKQWSKLSNLEIMQRGVNKLLSFYRRSGYHHTAIAVLFMHDGIGPSDELNGLLPSVRAWNQSGLKPRLVVATPIEFFSYLIQHDGKRYPVYRGDWDSLWSKVKLNSPDMSSDARFLQTRLPQVESLWSLLKMQNRVSAYPYSEIAEDYKGLFIYDEHNGAGQAGWPKIMTRQQVLEQNQEYSDWLRGATRSVKKLMPEGVEKLVSTAFGGSHAALVVYNPLSWISSQVVCLPGEKQGLQIRDAYSDSLVLSQYLPGSKLCFLARNVPSMGYRTYYIYSGLSSTALRVHSMEMDSPFFKVDLDPKTGQIDRIVDLRTHQTIVDKMQGGAAGNLNVMPQSKRDHRDASPIEILHERGALFDYVRIIRPGSVWPNTIIKLSLSEPTIDLDETLDRSKMPFVPYGKHPIMYSFVFRFLFSGYAQRWIDDGKGFFRFPQDLLPGTTTRAAVPRHVLVWSGRIGSGVYNLMLQQKQAFFDSFSDLTRRGHFFLYGVDVRAMLKSDQGNTRDQGIVSFKTFEPGYSAKKNFSFMITGASGSFNAVMAQRFGMQKQFIAVMLPLGLRPTLPITSFLSLNRANVIVECLKPSEDRNPKDYMLRLQEISGEKTRVKLFLAFPIQSIVETSIPENQILRGVANSSRILIKPYQTLTLRIRLK